MSRADQDRQLREGARAAKLLIERQKEDPLYLWEPFTPQQNFLQTEEPEAWYIGGNRTGKSDALAALLSSAMRTGNMDPRPAYAGSGMWIYDRAISIWVVSLTFPMSREIMQPKMFNNGYVPPGQAHPPFIPQYEIADWNQTNGTLRLKNGSIAVYKSADQRWDVFQGVGKDIIGFDEAPPKRVYTECAIRVEAGRPLVIRGACTLLPPEGVVGGITWLYSEKIRPWLQGQRKGIFLQGAKLLDNPYIDETEYHRLLGIYPPGSVDRAVRINGEWLPQIAGDMAYGNFRAGIHVNELLRNMGQWNPRLPALVAFDSNYSPCTLSVWQKHGRVYRGFFEIVLETGTIADLGRELKRRLPMHGAEMIIYGDATSTRKTAQTALSDYELLTNELAGVPYPFSTQIPTVNPIIRDRINALNFLMRGPNGEVRFELSPDMTETIEDFEVVLRDKKGGIAKAHDKNDPYYKRTHLSDGVGYLAWALEPVASVEALIQQSPWMTGSRTPPGRVPGPGYHFGR